ncbi:bifunctional 5,10-methylenetetrahydrofolate dehydrogenase/5,10-methenyltetrahydrofolate cyclohydrolase [Candidatus Kaiserbacteria bacterium]|nr:bifunctional 5,10-methylenetetrahydrofolate dehydrogenase/5,10-methenyltetrahydrofolate cyclohydrolase [Candidatus Kaiserbacteria bacterium]
MIINGVSIAQDILNTLNREIKGFKAPIQLVVFTVGSEPATEQFIALKKKHGERIGMRVSIERLPENVDTELFIQHLQTKAADKSVHGIVVQLPLPPHLDVKRILAHIPLAKDVDVLSFRSKQLFKEGTLDILPPVVGSMSEIFRREGVDVKGKRALIIGKGPLVGEPAGVWLKSKGAEVTIVDNNVKNLAAYTTTADIIVSGAGVPNLITSEMIPNGVILFDVGTSELRGKLLGDADPACASKCSIFTPVPKGIGPITVAMLLKNVLLRAPQELSSPR